MAGELVLRQDDGVVCVVGELTADGVDILPSRTSTITKFARSSATLPISRARS